MRIDTWLSAFVGSLVPSPKLCLGGTSRLDSLIIEQSRNNSQPAVSDLRIASPNFPFQLYILCWACI